MAGWRDVARSVREREGWDNRANRDDSPPIAPIVPIVPANPARTLREWSAALARVDPRNPLHDLPRLRWGRLIADVEWLLEGFGQQAAVDGWSALDLFGVLPGRDGWGGIADRLCASRSLLMTADRASWRRVTSGSSESYARAAGSMPLLVPMWEAERV